MKLRGLGDDISALDRVIPYDTISSGAGANYNESPFLRRPREDDYIQEHAQYVRSLTDITDQVNTLQAALPALISSPLVWGLAALGYFLYVRRVLK